MSKTARMAAVFCSLLLFQGVSAPDAAGAPALAGNRVAIRMAQTCPSDPDPLGLVDDKIYSDCDQDELDKLRGLLAADIEAKGVFGGIAEADGNLTLSVTLTKDQEIGTGTALDLVVDTNDWVSAAKYSLTDASGTVLSSGTAAVTNHTLDDGEAHRDLMAKIADAITSANIGAATAGGAPAAASTASGVAQSYAAGYAAGQLVHAVAEQNYRDLVAKVYRSLPTKPPVPADALADKTAGDAALARGDAAAASTAYLAAANSAIWWPEAHRALALALAKINQLASAIIEGRMYLQLVPNAPDVQSMNELVAEWSKAAPPPNLPSSFPMPPGLPGWGIQVADTPDVVPSAMGRPNAKGVLVLLVLTGSPAQTAGFEVGDVIVSVNGDAITSPENLRAITSTLPPHTTAQAAILRGGKQITLSVP